MVAASPQVILLAAGLGSRLARISHGLPKALVMAGGKTLLDHALDFAEMLEPCGRIVVGGYRFDLVADHIKARGEPGIRLVENTAYRGGNLLSVRAAMDHVRGAFYLMNIDHIFSRTA